MATINKNAIYFKQVASVIGDEQAEIELQKVIDSGKFCEDEDDLDMVSAFSFGSSPQGFRFWSKIADECGAWMEP